MRHINTHPLIPVTPGTCAPSFILVNTLSLVSYIHALTSSETKAQKEDHHISYVSHLTHTHAHTHFPPFY